LIQLWQRKFAVFQNQQILLDQAKLDQLLKSLPTDIQPMINQMVEKLRDALSASLSTVRDKGIGKFDLFNCNGLGSE